MKNFSLIPTHKLWLIACLLTLLSCQPALTSDQQVSTSHASVDHEKWERLLKKWVSEDGWVDYDGFLTEKDQLEVYLKELAAHPPTEDCGEKQALAYWINAYNAFTVKLILDHYPIESITDLHTIPVVATIWKKKFFQIGSQEMSLHIIEHKILRKDFREPRIHFAINCASVSCPVLRQEAYTAKKLETQLTDQAERFLADPLRNQVTADKVKISQIFLWFRSDFTEKGGLIDFLNQYASVEINTRAKVSYLSYDWKLNERQKQL
ncbi:MAG: DUF547 domain-containing protein [Bacteroidota bacterium]